MEVFANGMAKFTELRKFDLNLAANDLRDVSALYISEALSKMQNLRIFKFSFYSSQEVSDKAVEYYAKGISELKNIEKIALEFYK